MARSNNNYVTHGLTGRVGKEAVWKEINGKTYMGKYPDRSQVKYSKEQTKFKKLFAEASKHASKIVNDPALKSAYKTKGKISVYHAALQDYITSHSGKPRNKKQLKVNISKHLQHEGLNDRQAKAIKYMSKSASITNAVYQRLTGTSKPTATRDLQELVRLKIFSPPKTKGAGALYSLINE
jgi:Fic family protein